VKVWSLETLQCLDTVPHLSKVEALVATDKYLISGGTDNAIVVWSWRKGAEH